MSQKIIIGFTGLIASGKGTAAKYLEEKYGASTYRFSTMLRDGLDRFYISQTRENIVIFSEIMRQAFGQDLMAKVIANDARNDEHAIVVVEGIRRMPDITHLKEIPDFKLIRLVAEPQTRWERLTKRNENADDATKTYEQFQADHQMPTELTIPEVMGHADLEIDNNGDLDALYRQLDLLIAE